MARKAFRFRLEKLLDIRIMKEKLAQSELLARKAKVLQEQQKLQKLKAHEQEVYLMMEPKPGEAFDVEERMMMERYVKTVQQDQERQEIQIQKAEQAVREQEAVLKQAGIDVKVLEKLKEKQHEEFKAEALRENAYFLDDLASQQYIRAQETNARLTAEHNALSPTEETIGS